MTEKLKEFLAAAEKDAELTAALNNAESLDTLFAKAREMGFELTEEDLRPALPMGELADEDLDDVAGGMILNPLGSVWDGLTQLLQRTFGGRNSSASNGRVLFVSGTVSAKPGTLLFGSGTATPKASNLICTEGSTPGPVSKPKLVQM